MADSDSTRSYDPLDRLRAGDFRSRAATYGRCEDCAGYGRVDETACPTCDGSGTDPAKL